MGIQIPGLSPPPNVEETYPGTPLKLGDSGLAVLTTKNALNAISVNFTAIPKVYPVNSIFDESLEEAVKAFQNIFNLTVTGVIDKATWYEIRNVLASVRKLATSTAEISGLEEIPPIEVIEYLEVTPIVQIVQYFLNVLSAYYDSIPAVDINGMLNAQTINSISEFQKTFNLPVTGEIDIETWNTMYDNIQGILRVLHPSAIALPALLFPGINYTEGMEDYGVYIMQQSLLYISTIITDIPPVNPNGIFGPETTNSVRVFQNMFGLDANGVINKDTWDKIIEIYRQLRFSNTRTIGQYPGAEIG
jgi:peptidoglycan hydrolase-like protein with peptidoglycan-binding domain